MNKIDYAKQVVNTFHSDLDNVYERFKVKYALLAVLKNELTPVDVTVTDHPPTKTILRIIYPSGEINKNYDQMTTECRRIFISDLYSCSASFCIYLDNVLRKKNVNGRHLPAFFDKQYNQPLNILNRFLKSDDKLFLTFLHNVRNSMIHYDGQYNKKNLLDYKILTLEFKTTEHNLGEQIIWGTEEMIEVYKRLKSIFAYDIFINNSLFV
ncbi:MAG: hypothetical protein HY064_08740 [Bacteroidetes bacterium]|nr:hypothetical protein [Bacteroidota bacterium]